MLSLPFSLTLSLRRAFVVLTLALVAVVSSSDQAWARQGDAPAAVESATGEHEAAAHGDESHDAGWMPTVARVFNFLLLIGVLVYFLRTPLVQYLATRHTTIRRELVDAASLKATAQQQLESVRARLALLPGELKALEARGAEELAQERVRMKAATAEERDKLIERTRREIDLQFRVARRALVERTADLAIGLARTRIEQTITPADQARLVERYATEVRA